MEPIADERALVTGAAGFIGQHLVGALRGRGMAVRALVRPARLAGAGPAVRSFEALGVELAPGDVFDVPSLRSALQGVTHVFHLAGRLLVTGVDDAEYERLHVDGTRNLLSACLESRSLRAIVHCSTTGVLGPTGATPADEEAPLRPSTVYERTKAVGEKLALRVAAETGLPLSVARPGLVYGPGDLHLLGWFRAIDRGLYRVVGRGDNLLHPVYASDLVDGLWRCAAAPAAVGRVYHLVGERPVPIGELAAAIAGALGRGLPRTHLPLLLARAAAALLEALPGLPPERLPLTRGRVRFMTQSRAYSGERARRELGFVPRVDLETGLRRTVDWYRAEGMLWPTNVSRPTPTEGAQAARRSAR